MAAGRMEVAVAVALRDAKDKLVGCLIGRANALRADWAKALVEEEDGMLKGGCMRVLHVAAYIYIYHIYTIYIPHEMTMPRRRDWSTRLSTDRPFRWWSSGLRLFSVLDS